MADECFHCQKVGVKVVCKDFPLLAFCNKECAAASWEQGDFREATTELYAFTGGFENAPYPTIAITAAFINDTYMKLLSGINFQTSGAEFFTASYEDLLKKHLSPKTGVYQSSPSSVRYANSSFAKYAETVGSDSTTNYAPMPSKELRENSVYQKLKLLPPDTTNETVENSTPALPPKDESIVSKSLNPASGQYINVPPASERMSESTYGDIPGENQYQKGELLAPLLIADASKEQRDIISKYEKDLQDAIFGNYSICEKSLIPPEYVSIVQSAYTERWREDPSGTTFSTENRVERNNGYSYKYNVMIFKRGKSGSAELLDGFRYEYKRVTQERKEITLDDTYITKELNKLGNAYLHQNGLGIKFIFPSEWVVDKDNNRFTQLENPLPMVPVDIFGAFIATMYRFLRFPTKQTRMRDNGLKLWVLYYEFRMLVEQPYSIRASVHAQPIYIDFLRYAAEVTDEFPGWSQPLQAFLYRLLTKNEMEFDRSFFGTKNEEIYTSARFYPQIVQEELSKIDQIQNPRKHLIFTRALLAGSGKLYKSSTK